MTSSHRTPKTKLIARLRVHLAGVAWMLFERGWMFVSGVVIGFWMVRHLGPEAFGQFSAALSITVIFAGLALMGLDTVLVRRFALDSTVSGPTLVAALWVRAAGSVVHLLVCAAVALVFLDGLSEAALMAIIIASAAIFRVPDAAGLMLQARGDYRQAARLRVMARLVGDGCRVLLIIQDASAIWFAWAVVVESTATCLLFGWLARRTIGNAATDATLVRELFGQGRPVLVSGLLAAAYARMDQIVLYALVGATENGHYAAAVRVSEIFNLLVASIGAVAAAQFGRMAEWQAPRFDAALRVYVRCMTGAGLLISALLFLFAEPIVQLLYGSAFSAQTGQVLRVHAWTVLFVWSSVAMEPWFYHYHRVGALVPKAVVTLLASVPMVYAATRYAGPVGTAAAVVVTYFIAVFATNALVPSLRPAFRFQCSLLKPKLNASPQP